MMAFVLGMVIYGSSFAIPQFLAAVDDYDALQSGKVVVLSGVPSLLLMPFVPLLIRVLDIRVAVTLGLAVLAVSCWLNVHLTAESDGSSFTAAQLLRGAGTILCFLFLNQAAISFVDVSWREMRPACSTRRATSAGRWCSRRSPPCRTSG